MGRDSLFNISNEDVGMQLTPAKNTEPLTSRRATLIPWRGQLLVKAKDHLGGGNRHKLVHYFFLFPFFLFSRKSLFNFMKHVSSQNILYQCYFPIVGLHISMKLCSLTRSIIEYIKNNELR